MTDATFYTAYDDMPPLVRLRRGRKSRRGYGTLGVMWMLAAGVSALSAVPALAPGNLPGLPLAGRTMSPLKVADSLPVPQHITDDPLLLPNFVAGVPAYFAASRPVAARFVFADAPVIAAAIEAPAPTVSHPVAVAAGETVAPGPQIMAAAGDGDAQADVALPSLPSATTHLSGADVPVPTPRPTDIAPTVDHAPPFRATRKPAVLASVTPAAKPAISADNRGFIEKFFGLGQQTAAPATSALGYAAPEDGFFSSLRGGVGNPALSYGGGTAVYEIATHTVFMPDGTKLEAHSGLGARLDDVRFVHERMRGATPPATYALTMRESLFHGVQALRLTPVGSGVFGRVGLLAHTYMLGPNGDSNGCVSFRNYKAFLQAFQNGDVRRLVVVARLS